MVGIFFRTRKTMMTASKLIIENVLLEIFVLTSDSIVDSG